MKVLTFGETLFRLSVGDGIRLRDTDELSFYLGGSELNVAMNLVTLGVDAGWVSVIPEGAGGELILDRLRASGVDFSRVARAPGPLGFYFVEEGTPPRSSVALLRQKSLFSDAIAGRFGWSQELQGVTLFHTSGITAGLGAQARAEMIRAIEAARETKALVSYDCNFRRNLWSESEARAGQRDLLKHFDILFASPTDLKQVWDVEENAINSFFPKSGLRYLIVSQRDESEGTYGINVWSGSGRVESRRFAFVTLDRIGVGDSMLAGFLRCLAEEMSPQAMADFAAAAGALKYSIRGDQAKLRVAEVESLLKTGHRSVLR